MELARLTRWEQQKWLRRLAVKLRVCTFDGWYNVRTSDVKRLGGTLLLKQHGGSLEKLIKSTYTSYNWAPYFHSAANNRFKKLQSLAEIIGVKTVDDWYTVPRPLLVQNGGASLLQQHNGSLPQMVMEMLPEYTWMPWRFGSVPTRFWAVLENRVAFINYVEDALNITKPTDWYDVSKDVFIALGGNGLMCMYETVHKILSITRPSYQWLPWKFVDGTIPLSDVELSQFILETERHFDITEVDDWYRMDYDEVKSFASPLVDVVPLVMNALHCAYPEFDFRARKFEDVKFRSALTQFAEKINPLGKQDSLRTRTTFFKRIEVLLGITNLRDWYDISRAKLVAVGARKLLDKYANSIPKMLFLMHPEFEWNHWEFSSPVDRRKAFFLAARQKFDISHLDSWYQITPMDIYSIGGGEFLQKCNDSLYELLSAEYRTHKWKRDSFATIADDFWQWPDNHWEYMEAIKPLVNVKSNKDWNEVSVDTLQRLGGHSLLKYYGSLSMAINRLYNTQP